MADPIECADRTHKSIVELRNEGKIGTALAEVIQQLNLLYETQKRNRDNQMASRLAPKIERANKDFRKLLADFRKSVEKNPGVPSSPVTSAGPIHRFEVLPDALEFGTEWMEAGCGVRVACTYYGAPACAWLVSEGHKAELDEYALLLDSTTHPLAPEAYGLWKGALYIGGEMRTSGIILEQLGGPLIAALQTLSCLPRPARGHTARVLAIELLKVTMAGPVDPNGLAVSVTEHGASVRRLSKTGTAFAHNLIALVAGVVPEEPGIAHAALDLMRRVDSHAILAQLSNRDIY